MNPFVECRAWRSISRGLSILILSAPSVSAQGQVWTVDDDGPADFASLQVAIDTVASGDVLLVRSGTYGSMDVVGKSLTIQADEGATVTVAAGDGQVRITGLAATQSVRVRGLALIHWPNGIEISSNAGTVWIEECDVSCPRFGLGSPAILAEDSAAVVLIRTRAFGEAGSVCSSYEGSPGPRQCGPGLRLRNASVHAYGSAFFGGAAGTLDPDPWVPTACLIQEGGDGISSKSIQDFLFLSDCIAQGGIGNCSLQGDQPRSFGGAGVRAVGTAKVRDSVSKVGPR